MERTNKKDLIQVALKVNRKEVNKKTIPSEDWIVTRKGVENRKEIVFHGNQGQLTSLVLWIGERKLYRRIPILEERKRVSIEISRKNKVIIPVRGLRFRWVSFDKRVV